MCRLLLATGGFDVAEVLHGAEAMACGRTATHQGPTSCHPHGWGAIWRDDDAPHGLRVHRDTRPIGESLADSPLPDVTTDFLAVHTRYATLPSTYGLEFTHPLERPGDIPWYFMHNGYLPTVHRCLGLPESRFDSAEYFRYLVPPGARELRPRPTLARLRKIPPGGTSGNAIAVNPYSAHVIHWTPDDKAWPGYFTLSVLENRHSMVLSSEVLPQMAQAHRWRPLDQGVILRIPLTATVHASKAARQRSRVVT